VNENRTSEGSRLWRELWDGKWTVAEARTDEGHRTLVLRRPKPGASNKITDRERLALAMTARGLPLKHVAIDLGTSLPTACEIVKRALRKLGLSTRLDIAQWQLLDERDAQPNGTESETRHVA